MFAPELASGEVLPVLKEWTLPPMELWVIYPSGKLTSTKARAFMKWFETTITESK
jgi:DNA-binding transcriptional LysR family regulator